MNQNILDGLNVQIYSELPEDIKDKVNTYGYENGRLEDVRSPEQRELDHDMHYSKPYAQIYAFNPAEDIIGCVLLFSRDVSFKDEIVKMGGIGGVSTAINERKKGIATKLLKIGVDKLKEDGHAVAFLNTNVKDPKLRGLYERQGFKVFENDYKFTGKTGKEYVEDDGMLAPLNNIKIFQEIMNSKEILDIGAGNW